MKFMQFGNKSKLFRDHYEHQNKFSGLNPNLMRGTRGKHWIIMVINIHIN